MSYCACIDVHIKSVTEEKYSAPKIDFVVQNGTVWREDDIISFLVNHNQSEKAGVALRIGTFAV